MEPLQKLHSDIFHWCLGQHFVGLILSLLIYTPENGFHNKKNISKYLVADKELKLKYLRLSMSSKFPFVKVQKLV